MIQIINGYDRSDKPIVMVVNLILALLSDGFDEVTLNVEDLNSMVLSITDCQVSVTRVNSNTTGLVEMTLLTSRTTCTIKISTKFI